MKKYRQNKGITLVSLIITVIILLILAAVGIGTLGPNGLVAKAEEAKEKAQIDEEKEIVGASAVQSAGANRYGNIEKEELAIYVAKNAGNRDVEVIEDANKIYVNFKDTERYYEVGDEGDVSNPIIKEKIEYAGDITKGGTLDGSIEKPYEIWCIEDLVAFSNKASSYGGNVVLKRTLDFNSIFSYNDFTTTQYGDLNTDGIVEDIKTELTKTTEGCIGFKEIRGFNGTFDGQENAIKNIYQYKSNNNDRGMYLALFVDLNKQTTIKNLTLTGEIINKVDETAGIICYSSGGTVINCRNYANVTGQNWVNGIGNGCYYIEGCVNYGKIVSQSMSYSYGGASGICSNPGVKIVNCINEGEIITNGKWGWYNYSGGITCTSQGITIQNCANKGKCDAGIIGWIKPGATTIENCYNIGECTSAIIGTTLANDEASTISLNNLYYQIDKSTVSSEWSEYVTGLTELEMKNNTTFLQTLNNNIGENAEWTKWKIGEDGYPTFE